MKLSIGFAMVWLRVVNGDCTDADDASCAVKGAAMLQVEKHQAQAQQTLADDPDADAADEDEDEEDDKEEGKDEPLATCSVESMCGSVKVLNANFKVWPTRSCQHVLDNEGGWICNLKYPGAVRYFKDLCCREPGEPEPSNNIGIRFGCGPGKRVAEAKRCRRIFRSRRPCGHVAEQAWVVARPNSGGAKWFRRQCCEAIPEGEDHLPASIFEERCPTEEERGRDNVVREDK